MSASSFGQHFKITSFGESHGPALGVVIEGCPAGVLFDQQILNRELSRRKPGGALVSARNESDIPEILSGVFEGQTLGTPIAVVVKNTDARPDDYKNIQPGHRAGHADDLWVDKFGISDPRGGGRASGRETVSRIIAGSFAQMVLNSVSEQYKVTGFAKQIGPFEVSRDEALKNAIHADTFPARFPCTEKSKDVESLLIQAKEKGQSFGGVAEIWLDGIPRGLGQPVFHKLKSDLAGAIMSIGATSGIEIGDGFSSASAEGSQFHRKNEVYGGIRGGISTGEQIVIRVSFKPTSSVLDVAKKGRHDPCIVPRAIPVIEAMCHLVIADHLIWACGDKIQNLKRIFS